LAKYKWYRIYFYLLLEAVRTVLLVLPRPISLSLAKSFGAVLYWVLYEERFKIQTNLRIAIADQSDANERKRIGQRIFINLGKTAADVCRLPKFTAKKLGELIHLEGGTNKIDLVRSRGCGGIILTGHIGNWELLGPYIRRFCGYPGCAVGRRIYYEPYNRFLVNLRKSGLVSTIYRDESPRRILAKLKRNQLVGMTPDQDIDSLDGMYIPFFGKNAWTPVAPAKIARASGAPIVPMFVIHVGDRYQLFIEDPIWPIQDESKDAAVRRMTEEWSHVVERYIRQYPDQWVWMHDRWKTKQAVSETPATHEKEMIRNA
jgi:Kdo2-lipid IVA lauroyltransferase/acyltransferase